jgi:hypothetical protein
LKIPCKDIGVKQIQLVKMSKESRLGVTARLAKVA